MKHYNDGKWTDFVRQLLPAAERAAMQDHLDSCQTCRLTVGCLEATKQVAAIDSQISVPPEVAARARALFDKTKPERSWFKGLRQLAAELVFDSSRDLLPAGMRFGGTPGTAEPRHISYRAGEYDVHLRLEPTDAGVAEIVGQVVSRQVQAVPMEGLLVQVIAGGRTVGETETNRFGEFVLERPVRPTVTLRISLRDAGCRIELPLRTVKRA